MVRCGPNNGHQKDMCLKESGLHSRHLLTILGLIVNKSGGGGHLCDHVIRKRNFTLTIIFQISSRNCEESCYGVIGIF